MEEPQLLWRDFISCVYILRFLPTIFWGYPTIPGPGPKPAILKSINKSTIF